MSAHCTVIGMLDDGLEGLNQQQLRRLRTADVVIAGTRLLNTVRQQLDEKVVYHDLTGQLANIPVWIEQSLKDNLSVAVLATGDPLCHGIANYLYRRIEPGQLEILPNVSTIQLACARLGIAWPKVHISSIHSKDSGEWHQGARPEHGMYHLVQALRQQELVVVFTSPDNTPGRIARMLLLEHLDEEFEFSVVSHLLQSDEKVQAKLDILHASETEFDDPNIVILQRKRRKHPQVLFGLSDDDYIQRKPEKGLITKREVRAVSLARMQLRANSIVWDIGAGSGSLGLEAARLCPQGHVFAIEKNADDIDIIKDNWREAQISNYTLLHDKAPQGMQHWLDPDAIFIGGSGGELPELIRLGLDALNEDGWLVMNFVTLENLTSAINTLQTLQAFWDVTQIQASRSQPILHMHRMAAENAVWIVSAQAGGED